MFFDYKGPQSPEEAETWQRIERTIYSPWWRAAHNLIAHPMLAIYRPLGEKLHEYTAEKMYEYNPKYDKKITDND